MLFPRIWCRGRIYSTRNGFDKSNPYINSETGGSILVKTGIYLFYSLVPLGTMHRAPTSDSLLLAAGSFYSRDTRYATRFYSDSWILAPDFFLLNEIRFTKYDIRDTNYATRYSIFFFTRYSIRDMRYYSIAIFILLQNKKIKRINPILIFILSNFFLNIFFFFTQYTIRVSYPVTRFTGCPVELVDSE